jgi:2,3-bisphosphoglycerate-dependent phosphoglycerate mutase
MTKLIIARHGNTFEKGETPRRAGARTDLPLTETGREQAQAIGCWMKKNGHYPEAVYSSQLIRTKETAALALEAAGYKEPVFPLEIFNEIDYGPDENLPEDAVIARLGEQALKDWDEKAVVPEGWNFSPGKCISDWKNFAAHIVEDGQNCVLVVTSNGIARFAPYITREFEEFRKNHGLKISTGAVCVFEYADGKWVCREWNLKPASK